MDSEYIFRNGTGKKMDVCRVCGWSGEAERYEAREMMIGKKDTFVYFRCPQCDCLQIVEIPDNLGDYYGKGYYSFREPNTEAKKVDKVQTERILDVGCGAGLFLCALAEGGYINLTGCDPFAEKDLFYENGVRIYKKTIHEMDGEFDVIYLNDSFEHVTDPHEVMESIYRLLAPNGVARIRLPVFPNIAFDMFGTNWYQLDAPRHIFLHSKKSMVSLAEQHRLRIVKKQWDSNNSQIIRSFLYTKDVLFWEQTPEIISKYFDQNAINQIDLMAQSVNEQEYGDHAVFFLVKNDKDGI